ncbi:MAG: restriction endonuclease subunit S [Candidatus Nanoarchaeia archaeon]|nr:restriction endonuclease subunit S [Candidatus Nanoarchaeia archaeon]
MILQKYDSYKDSGVEWLGEIPKDWEVKRLKDVYKEIGSGGTPSSENLNYYEGNIPWVRSGDLNNSIVEDVPFKITNEALNNSSAKMFPKGTFIIAMYGASVGKMGILGLDASTNQACCCIVTNKNKIDIKYLYYYYNFYKPLLIKDAVGGGQPNISQGLLKLSWLIYPEKNQQTAISNFLDKKTSQIDSKINLLQEKITSYEDLKKSVINETVCRGLNKDVELKDSEIEWIGNIPKHWKVERLKNIFNERVEKNKKLDGEPITDNILSVMKDIGVINHRDKGNVGNKMSEDISGYKIVHPKDIVVNKMNVIIGSVGISKEYGALSVIYIILKTKPESHPEFYDYVFRSKYFQKYLRTIATGILEIREAVNSTLFKHQGLPNPPKEEQIQIANYLDEKITKIDNIISKIKDQINTLKEFRKTVINDVVTGKVRVEE